MKKVFDHKFFKDAFTKTTVLRATVAMLFCFMAITYFVVTVFDSWRWDLTQGNLYTVSKGTRSILKNVNEPITLTLYYSENFSKAAPAVAAYAERVKNTLNEYARIGGKHVRVRIVNPEPFTDKEDEALQQGAQPIPMAGGEQFYFGLVGTNSINTMEVLPFLQPSQEHLLEYDLSKTVYRLTNAKRPTVGIVTTLPMDGDVWASLNSGANLPESWVSITQVRNLFNTRMISSLAKDLTPDIDVLWLAHATKLTPEDYYALDQYVLKGGRVLMFVDPLSEALAKRTPAEGAPGTKDKEAPLLASGLGPFQKTWGINMLPGKVIADLDLAQRIKVSGDNPLSVIDYPVWLGVKPPYFNKDEVISANLGLVTVATAGVLEKVDTDNVTVTALMTSSSHAKMESMMKVFPYPDYTGLVRDFVAEDKPLMLAARISGNLKTAFPDGFNGAADQIKASQKPANIIVVADTDMLEDQFWVATQDFNGQRLFQPFANNGDFLINALEYLTGSDALISLRSRGSYLRPFTLVDKIQRNAESAFLQKEAALKQKLATLQQKLMSVQAPTKDGEPLQLTSSQQQAVREYQDQMLQTRKELRDVQADLKQNILALKNWLAFFCIGFMPIAVMIAPFVWRRRKRFKIKK